MGKSELSPETLAELAALTGSPGGPESEPTEAERLEAVRKAFEGLRDAEQDLTEAGREVYAALVFETGGTPGERNFRKPSHLKRLIREVHGHLPHDRFTGGLADLVECELIRVKDVGSGGVKKDQIHLLPKEWLRNR